MQFAAPPPNAELNRRRFYLSLAILLICLSLTAVFWKVSCHAPQIITQKHFPAFVIFAGIQISFLIAGMYWALGTSRDRAVQYANKMTRELQSENAMRLQTERQLREAMNVKSDFTSMVSHELRTPLMVIAEGIEAVAEGVAGAINDEQKDLLLMAKNNVDRLTRFIHSVLDYQKLDAGRLELTMETFNINELITEITGNFARFARQKGVELAAELDPALPLTSFDRDKIAEVLVNFISNAIKFTDRGSVKVKSIAADSGVRVEVADQGIGIKEEDLSKLFQSFSQVNNVRERKTGGSGLGLAISKKIIEKHDGKIGVESVWGKGSVFYFTLPVRVLCSLKKDGDRG